MTRTAMDKKADGLFTFAIFIGATAGITASLAPSATWAIPLVIISAAGIADGAMYRLADLLSQRAALAADQPATEQDK